VPVDSAFSRLLLLHGRERGHWMLPMVSTSTSIKNCPEALLVDAPRTAVCIPVIAAYLVSNQSSPPYTVFSRRPLKSRRCDKISHMHRKQTSSWMFVLSAQQNTAFPGIQACGGCGPAVPCFRHSWPGRDSTRSFQRCFFHGSLHRVATPSMSRL